jgi:hypothetical protein
MRDAVANAVEAIVAAVRSDKWEPDDSTRAYFAELVQALGDPLTLVFVVRLPDAVRQLREVADLLEAPPPPLTYATFAEMPSCWRPFHRCEFGDDGRCAICRYHREGTPPVEGEAK